MKRKNAFTLIELLVVIAIIAILAAILFPVFAQAKEAAKKTAALAQMKQLGMSIMMYASDYDDMFVPSTNYQAPNDDPNRIWTVPVYPYAKSKNIFVAPGADGSKFAENWSERGLQSIGMSGATAIDTSSSGCVEDQPNQFGCEGFTTPAGMGKMDEPALTGLFATTPHGPTADKYRGYVFSPYNSVEHPTDKRLSPPLVSDRDLVKEMNNLPPSQLKPIYARYGKTSRDDGTTPVIFGDGHAKTYTAKAIKGMSSGIIWRFR